MIPGLEPIVFSILMWLSNVGGFSHDWMENDNKPKVSLVTQEELRILYCPNHIPTCNIGAGYDGDGTLILGMEDPKNVTLTPEEIGTLVHELVHHLQSLNEKNLDNSKPIRIKNIVQQYVTAEYEAYLYEAVYLENFYGIITPEEDITNRVYCSVKFSISQITNEYIPDNICDDIE